jgi:hypothetical protein
MFKLLGADQKEYGPVSADQIRQWIAQGRANARTKLQAAGSTEWKPLAEYPEFADAFRTPASPAAQPTAGGPKTSGLAITSLVLGCLGLLTCGITSLAGLVLGIIALVRINKSGGQLGGKGMALAGTSVSAVVLLLALAAAAVLPGALAKIKELKAANNICVSNISQLSVGVMMYATDNNERLPAGTNWCDVLMPYVKIERTYVCGLGKRGQKSHYAFNAKLAGREMKDIQTPAQTVLIFEADSGWNAAGGQELFPAKPRHDGLHAVGFADGHAELVQAARLEKLRWEP